MSLTVLVLVQWLHILCGIVWFGGYIFMDFVLWPVLLRMPAAQAKTASESIGRLAGPLMAVSGSLVILLGIVRGTFLGPIRSPITLFTSAYGLTWLAALVLALLLSAWGANWHTRLLGPVWEDEVLRPGAVTRLCAGIAVEMTGFGLILACMVMMGIGL